MTILDPLTKTNKQPKSESVGLITAVFRFFRFRLKAPATFAGMTYEESIKSAAANPPPQSWWEEDMTGLRGPASDAKTAVCQKHDTHPVK